MKIRLLLPMLSSRTPSLPAARILSNARQLTASTIDHGPLNVPLSP